MIEFENKNVTVRSQPTCFFVPEGLFYGDHIYGDHIYVDSTPNRDKKFNVTEGGIWMMDLNDSFQNKDNFVKGVKYVSELSNPKMMKRCFDILDSMTENYEYKNTMEYYKLLGFFCELGVWKDPKLRQKSEYHKDFTKYLSNCYNLYFELDRMELLPRN